MDITRHHIKWITSILGISAVLIGGIFENTWGKDEKYSGERGIGGVRIGHTLSRIEESYGAEYGALVQDFYNTTLSIGDSTPAGGGDPLEISIDVIRQDFSSGGYRAVPVVDGDTLTQKDLYKIVFQANMACHLYIVQLDSTGKMDPIFPSQFTVLNNPVDMHVHYEIPSGNQWLFLDANSGVETIYFIASRRRRPDIENIMMTLQNRNRTLAPQKPVRIDQATTLNRGIGGMRPGESETVAFQNGATGNYTPTLIQSVQAEFVMTRYFYHR